VPGNLVLIGFSGTGKSTIGRILADQLGWELVDTDTVLVERFGKPIGEVFRQDGELVFRKAEREAVIEACRGARRVISVGGGAPVDLASRGAMTDQNYVVRLDATPETLLRRLRGTANAEERPMLAGTNPLGRIQQLLRDRDEVYAIAALAVDTECQAPADIATEILGRLRSWLPVGSLAASQGE